jgi:C-terminal processing protease CtpA/Prc
MKKCILSAGLFLVFFLALNAYGAAEFGGVGIDGVPLGNGEIVVRQLVAGGPAFRAGICKGDVITAVDGMPTKGSNFAEMVTKRLRGRAGTKVRLTVRRPGEIRLLQFMLERRELVLQGK